MKEVQSGAYRPRVLLADDEPDIVLVTKTRIQLNGYDVIIAADGEAALARIRETRPDLILLDLKMPKLDGFQVCKIVKSDPALQHIPVLLFSASSSYALCLEKQCLQLGADGYVRKPFDIRELLGKIAALINRGTRSGMIGEIRDSQPREQRSGIRDQGSGVRPRSPIPDPRF